MRHWFQHVETSVWSADALMNLAIVVKSEHVRGGVQNIPD
jgi:hypothetical protein